MTLRRQYKYLFWDANVLLHEWRYNKPERPTPVTDEQGAPLMKNPEPTPNVITWVYEDGGSELYYNRFS